MERKDFFKKACLYGICSCAGLSLIANSEAFATENNDWSIFLM